MLSHENATLNEIQVIQTDIKQHNLLTSIIILTLKEIGKSMCARKSMLLLFLFFLFQTTISPKLGSLP